jgi:hypothetical protein
MLAITSATCSGWVEEMVGKPVAEPGPGLFAVLRRLTRHSHDDRGTKRVRVRATSEINRD